MLTGVRYLQTSLENVLRLGDPDCESDGWLLENSLMETARTNLSIIKSLGKNNQINTANNGDPNINVPPTSKAHYGPESVPPKGKMETSWTFRTKIPNWKVYSKLWAAVLLFSRGVKITLVFCFFYQKLLMVVLYYGWWHLDDGKHCVPLTITCQWKRPYLFNI